jgi:hypothetical protein
MQSLTLTAVTILAPALLAGCSTEPGPSTETGRLNLTLMSGGF